MENHANMKQFIRYVSANIISMLGLSFYILIDTYFIAKGMGAAGLTALNLALPIYNVVNGSGLMMGIGCAAQFITFRIQRKEKQSQNVFFNSLFLWGIFSIIFFILGLFFSSPLAKWLGADMETFDMTRIYLKYILLFSPAFMLNNILSTLTKNDEAPRLAMIATLAGTLFNCIFDYIFIFPLGMGMLGAVLATGFSPILGVLLLLPRILKNQRNFAFKNFPFSFQYIKGIFTLGISSFINEFASGFVMLTFNFLILSISNNLGLAAYGVIANVYLVVIALFTGIAQGAQPLFSTSYAKQDKKGLRNILKYSVVSCLLFSFFIYLICIVFRQPIVAVFNQENNQILQTLSEFGMTLYFLAIPFMGINIILGMYFITVEQALSAQIVTLLRGVFLVIAFAFLLSALFKMTGIWLTPLFTELCACLAAIFLFMRKKNKTTGLH